MHKTGSGAVQKALDVGVPDPRFVYPRLGASNHSHPLRVLFSDGPELRGAHLRPRTRARLIEAIERRPAATVILSGEGIVHLEPEGLDRMKRFLTRRLGKVEIVAYVRPAVGYMQSAFQQKLKRRITSFDWDMIAPDYRRRFERFDAVFGRDAVRFWKYDPGAFPGGSVVRDFCDRLGIAGQVADMTSNASLSREATALLYCYRSRLPERVRSGDHKGLLEVLREVGHQKLRFSPAFVGPALERMRDDIDWMEQRAGFSLGEDRPEHDGDIREEADLMRPGADVLNQVARLADPASEPAFDGGEGPEVVAGVMQRLSERLEQGQHRN